MIKTIEIKNFKSIKHLTLNLGRVNVFIGENGAGKSNVLEAIALVGAASANKLDNEFLASRGIRVTSPHLMRQAFDEKTVNDPIEIVVKDDFETKEFSINNDNQPYSKWEANEHFSKFSTQVNFDNVVDITRSMSDFLATKELLAESKLSDDLEKVSKSFSEVLLKTSENINDMLKKLEELDLPKDKRVYSKAELNKLIGVDFMLPEVSEATARTFKSKLSSINKSVNDFLIYSPENSSLKLLEKEGQIEPLGINGEGLLKFITVLSEYNKDDFLKIKTNLKLLGWFKDISVDKETKVKDVIRLKDKYLKSQKVYLEQLSANEGFLFLLFYFSLFCSKLTPRFFAIDNIDSSLNPKLCEHLIKKISQLSVEYSKQVILTTHNPSVLDGLDLNDDQQKLFMISRSREGYTRIKPILKPVGLENKPQRMSQLFISGALGGIPTRF